MAQEDATLSERIYLRVSKPMDQKLEDIRVREGLAHKTDVVRVALEHYLDYYGDVVGSKRNFSRSLASQISYLDRRMSAMIQANQRTTAQLFAALINLITDEEGQGTSRITGSDLFSQSAKAVVENNLEDYEIMQQLLAILIKKQEQYEKAKKKKKLNAAKGHSE